VCAQAQKPTPAKVTKADAQKVLKIISSDKAKTRIYCQMAKLGDQLVARPPWSPSPGSAFEPAHIRARRRSPKW
ncbi:MAG: hypothetical protein WBW11_23610, partial [Pseudolabrys sp.]